MTEEQNHLINEPFPKIFFGFLALLNIVYASVKGGIWIGAITTALWLVVIYAIFFNRKHFRH